MKLMHTKLPEFISKMERAAVKFNKNQKLEIRGLENLKSAKMQSLRTGRIEDCVEQIAKREDVEKVELVVMPRVPETMHTVLIKGIGRDGKPTKIIMEVINILHATPEAEFDGCEDIEDHRPRLGLH